MPSTQADATVAIPWFNNIWFNNVAPRAPSPPTTAATAAQTPTTTTPTPTTMATPRRRRPENATRTPTHLLCDDTTTTAQTSETVQHPLDTTSRDASSQSEDRLRIPSRTGTQPHSMSSSRHTISTLSAVDRISLISLLSTGRPSASDVLRTLSDPDVAHLAHAATAVVTGASTSCVGATATAAATSLALTTDRLQGNMRLSLHLAPNRSAPHIWHASTAGVVGEWKKGGANGGTVKPDVQTVAVRRVASTPCQGVGRMLTPHTSRHVVIDRS